MAREGSIAMKPHRLEKGACHPVSSTLPGCTPSYYFNVLCLCCVTWESGCGNHVSRKKANPAFLCVGGHYCDRVSD